MSVPTDQLPTNQTPRPFSESTKCAACGNDDSKMTFLLHGAMKLQGPVMEKTCYRCGYKWYEIPLYVAKEQWDQFKTSRSSLTGALEWLDKLNSTWDTIYRDCWVAVDDGSVVARASTVDELLERFTLSDKMIVMKVI